MFRAYPGTKLMKQRRRVCQHDFFNSCHDFVILGLEIRVQGLGNCTHCVPSGAARLHAPALSMCRGDASGSGKKDNRVTP